tara:strand:- start:991 stop:1911 length:921 start_codon:yes stop_codon:yes gene_type:complete
MKIIVTILFISSIFFNKAQTIESQIVHNIQGEIITNIDIKMEFKYLLALNTALKELDKDKILKISNESIIREKIKEIELLKNFKEIKVNETYAKSYLENIYSRLDIKSLDEFKLYLKKYDLTLKNVERKMAIELLWNDLIVEKYKAQIKINKKQIRKKILDNKKIKLNEYQLSEIIFSVKNKNEIEKKYAEIIKSINKIGFENTVSIFSISDTAKIGGDIGWINENSINVKIKENITSLEIGKVTKPIILPNGILILKVMNVRKSQIEIDTETEFEKAVNFERNRQLSQFSQIYYNKIKKKLEFNE